MNRCYIKKDNILVQLASYLNTAFSLSLLSDGYLDIFSGLRKASAYASGPAFT